MEGHSRSPLPPLSPDNQRTVRRAPTDATMLPMGARSTSISVGDIYYILFRHKWKIILCSIIGVLLAIGFRKLNPPPYQSTARLFIRYVMENQGMGPAGEEEIRTQSPGQRGDTILVSEVAILTSLDLSKQVAAAVGPEKILAKFGGRSDLNAAAGVVRGGLDVQITPRSSVINIVFENTDYDIVQPVLTELVDRYLKRHVEIHRGTGMVDGFLAQQTDQLRVRLTQTEDELRQLLNKAGVISLTEAKHAYAEQITKLKQEIFAAEAELAERTSMLQEMNPAAAKSSQTDAQESNKATLEPTPDQIKTYQNLTTRLDALQKREMELLSYFREDNTRVQEVRSQLSDLQSQKKNMEETYPNLVRVVAPTVTPTATGIPIGVFDPATEVARLTALKSKIRQLNAQLQSVRVEAANTDQTEVAILQLMRQKELEETNYKNYSRSLEQARINEALGSGSVSNISQIQTPSPPTSDMTKTYKVMLGLAAGGVCVGLGWAFAIEMLFDSSVRRPIDVERMLRLPLFLSIPKLTQKELKHSAANPTLALLQSTNPIKSSTDLALQSNKVGELAPWDSEHALNPFHETLRDRLIGYFESKGLTHKPKMVAVTGLGHGGGVTTIAAGLASSLSETGDGNVLLVDMTQGQGSAQQFYQGKAVCGIEEILDARDSAKIDGNLFVVGQEPGGEKLSRILPHRFNQLVPKLKASNFDYIIFDMPPVSQISITPRLAGFMDMVLLVLESEKTDRELVRRATALLAESKAHVGAVLNKTKNYVPAKLHQDNLGNM